MPDFVTEKKYTHDILMWYANREYCLTAATVKNVSGSTITVTDLIGMPVKNNAGTWEFILTAASADAEGIIVGTNGDRGVTALATATATTDKYIIAYRGPIILNKSKIAVNDMADAAYSASAIETALAALSPPILLVTEPLAAVTSTQET